MVAAFVIVATWFSEFWEAFVEQFAERLGPKDIGAEISEAIMQVQMIIRSLLLMRSLLPGLP